MTRPVRVAVQIQPGGTPDYRTWRDAVLAADDLGGDVIFAYDHGLARPNDDRTGGG